MPLQEPPTSAPPPAPDAPDAADTPVSVLDRVRSAGLGLVRWLLGDIPEIPRARDSGTLAVWACFAAAVGMWLGLRQAVKGDPVLVGGWRMVAHGGPPLLALGLWELRERWRARTEWSVPNALLTLGGMALVLVPLAMRFTDAGPAWLAAAPYVRVGLVPLVGAVLMLYGLHRLGSRLADWGIGMGDWRWWLPHHGVLLASLVPVLVATTMLVPPLAAYYPVNKAARTSFAALMAAHSGIALDFIGWEFLFRGFLLFAVARRGDALLAILMQAFPFYLLHNGKPDIEMISSYIGGIFAGWFCLRARTFFPLYVIHLTMITTVGCTSFYLRNY